MSRKAAAVLVVALFGLVSTGMQAAAAEPQVVRVLSSGSRVVSAGSALLSIAVPDAVNATQVRVRVGATDETSRFKRQGRSLIGVVDGLKLGPNTIVATYGLRRIGALTLVNHNRNGPVFSGPHQHPFVCETDKFKLPDGSTLGPPQDKDCNIATRIMFFYKPADGGPFKLLPSPGELPSDIAETTTSEGNRVKFVVRLETGTLNRAVYQTAVLFDPTSEGRPDPFKSYKGWNRKIIYDFGGGASAGYRQGTWAGILSNPIADNERMLGKGYAVLAASLNVFQTTANDVVSAETASMVKESFIKTFGAPLYTIGWGGSGGAMQQYLIANNYPGILDGITPSASFPDLQTLSHGVDCALLARAFAAMAHPLNETQKTAVSGWNTWATCDGWAHTYSPYLLRARQGDTVPMALPGGGEFDTNNCGLDVPRSLTYDPATNPKGARCDMYSGIINIVGVDPATGFAASAFDNVGVQYGLGALRSGVITPEQFIEINERTGGFDKDGNFQSGRSSASLQALKAVYETGRVNEGANLDRIPIIDNRPDPGLMPNVHDSVRSMVTRARLIRAHGKANNQIIVRYRTPPPRAGSGEVAGGATVEDYVLHQMDEWLTNIRNDTRPLSATAKVVADKPADLTDACFPSPEERISETADVQNRGKCGRLMPFYSNPRMVAGEPLTDDVMKCQLRPIRSTDYPHLQGRELARLRAAFPSGVCDYSKPSVGFMPLKSTWLSYPAAGNAKPLY